VSYYRADTSNSQGWRPGTVQLGYLSSGRQNGPNWKDVAAQHDAAIRGQRHRQRGLERALAARMHAVDAAARGDRSRVRMPRLSGLGLNAIDQGSMIVPGAQYAFHFTTPASVTLLGTSAQTIAQAISTDGNFGGVQVATESGGFQVRFIFNGQVGPGSTVGSYGLEMQNVINSHALGLLGISGGASFLAAEGGPAAVSPNPNPTNPLTSPGASDNNGDGGDGSPPTFDLGTFLSGLGVGGAVALGLGLLLVMKS
jgi:hypothetical protein